VIRLEEPGDRATLRAINLAAFGEPDEAKLVEALHEHGAVLVSLVAEVDSRTVGHILFSRMWIDAPSGTVAAVALGPMAVLPGHQRRGIGGRLIARGLDLLRERGERIVIVLGHPEYYSRFGFSAEKARGLDHPFPPEALMALELEAGALAHVHGKLKYDAAFGIRF